MKSAFRLAMIAIATAASVQAPLKAQEPPALKLVRDLRIDAAEVELSPITYMAVSPNGTIVVQQNQDGTVRFLLPGAPRWERSGARGRVQASSPTPAGYSGWATPSSYRTSGRGGSR